MKLILVFGLLALALALDGAPTGKEDAEIYPASTIPVSKSLKIFIILNFGQV